MGWQEQSRKSFYFCLGWRYGEKENYCCFYVHSAFPFKEEGKRRRLLSRQSHLPLPVLLPPSTSQRDDVTHNLSVRSICNIFTLSSTNKNILFFFFVFLVDNIIPEDEWAKHHTTPYVKEEDQEKKSLNTSLLIFIQKINKPHG